MYKFNHIKQSHLFKPNHPSKCLTVHMVLGREDLLVSPLCHWHTLLNKWISFISVMKYKGKKEGIGLL